MKGQTNVDTTITTLEFCAGYGGIGLGLKNIFGERMRTIAYCELEGFAQANLISKMEKGLMDVAPIWSDLKTFPYESFYGLVDILIAGYPCQPFSSAGKRAGKEDPRHLWPWIADGIRLLQPRMCFFENVEGHISLGLSTVISDLEELGYKSSFGIFSASEVGAVHQRKRVFILAHRSGMGHGQEGIQDGIHKWSFSLKAQSHRSECRELWGATIGCCAFSAWPSRPGEPQHGWEPPRVVANTQRSRGEEPEHLDANLPSEPSGSDSEGLGNAEQFNDSRKIGADELPSGPRGLWPCGESFASPDGQCGEAQPSLGRDADGPAGGLDISELSGLCHSELAEIREWMVKGDNRTDELRSCGNGVVPATAERAFRVLMEELINK